MLLAKQWLKNTRAIMTKIEETQEENIMKAAEVMANTIEQAIKKIVKRLYIILGISNFHSI